MAREGVAQAGTVREDQVGLKLGKPVVRDARVRQQAEAGVHAIDGLSARNDAFHRSRGLCHALERGIVQPELRAGPQLPQVV